MRFPKDTVYTAIGLYTDGLSLGKVRKRIKKIYGIVIKSNQTILNWLKKFGKKPVQAVKNLAERLHGDETKIKTFQKGKCFWLWIIKRKFLPYVRSKSTQAQYNEILCKVICHNASVLVNSIFELDVNLNFERVG